MVLMHTNSRAELLQPGTENHNLNCNPALYALTSTLQRRYQLIELMDSMPNLSNMLRTATSASRMCC